MDDGRPMYFDKDGIPMSSSEFNRRLGDMDYRRVGLTRVMDGADPSHVMEVSTVWLGLDYSFGRGLPLIFESMTFAEGSREGALCDRHATLAQAEAGHTAMVVEIAATMVDPIVMDVCNEREGGNED